jgi:hypothetical protein
MMPFTYSLLPRFAKEIYYVKLISRVWLRNNTKGLEGRILNKVVDVKNKDLYNSSNS